MLARRLFSGFTLRALPNLTQQYQAYTPSLKHFTLTNTITSKFSTFTTLGITLKTNYFGTLLGGKLLDSTSPTVSQTRSFIKFSARKGKRKTVHAVTKRFYRLHWGIWIRTIAGRQKKLWRKSVSNRRTLKTHVFTNAVQSHMLDKMVSKFWRKPKYYIDDPYKAYHSREYFPITRTKPWRPEGVDYE